jgi:hypothetical protein
VLTLMLLWRHGVINFNVKQDGVKTAMPWLITQTAQSGIGWEDCQNGFREKPERVSLKTAKARKHWAKGDFGRDFDAGGLPTLTGDGSPPSAIRHSEK